MGVGSEVRYCHSSETLDMFSNFGYILPGFIVRVIEMFEVEVT